MTNPRVMMSGTPSSAPVCLLMATTGTTRPSSARWRRSRSTSSPTSPVRVPSISTRPTGALPAMRAPVASKRRTSPFSASRTSGLGSRPREHPLGDARVLRQLAVFAVDRHEVARPDQRQHQLQLFLAAVAGHVHVLDAFVDDVGAAAREVVHHAADRLLVAGNRARREHDRVVRAELHVAVVVDRDARQRRHRLALRSGGQAQHVLRRVAADVASRESARRPGCAGSRAAARSREFCDHPAADERDLAIELRRQVDEDLHPVDARRERRDDQPAGRAREDLLERVDDFASPDPVKPRRSMLVLSANSASTPCAPSSREAVHVEVLAVDRRLIDLEVAGVDDDAGRRVDAPARRSPGMLCVTRMNSISNGPIASRGRAAAPRTAIVGIDAVLLELRLDERQRQRRAVDRCRRRAAARAARRRCDPRGRASAPARRRAPSAAGRSRSGMIRSTPSSSGSGNMHAGVDDDRRLAPGERQHVHAELAESAERHDFDGWSAGLSPGVCDGHRCPSAGVPAAEAFVSDTQASREHRPARSRL